MLVTVYTYSAFYLSPIIMSHVNTGGGRNAERAECRTHFRAECRQGGMPKGGMPKGGMPTPILGGMPKQEGPEMKACSRQPPKNY